MLSPWRARWAGDQQIIYQIGSEAKCLPRDMFSRYQQGW